MHLVMASGCLGGHGEIPNLFYSFNGSRFRVNRAYQLLEDVDLLC